VIIWRGAGIVVPGLAFVVLLLTSLVVSLLFKDDNYFGTHGWPRLVACWITAFLLRYVGMTLDKKETRVVVDKQTGEELVLKPHHDFFFIKLEYWAWILFVAGIVLLFVKI
jgi:hypothetical protein